MPIFRIYVKQTWQGYEWGNTFYVNAASETAAVDAGLGLQTVISANTWNLVTFPGVRVSTAAQDGRTGRTYGGTFVGGLSLVRPLPIFNCGRVQFVPGVKQANTKFFHFTIGGSEQSAGELEGPPHQRLLAMANGILAVPGVCDRNGGAFTGRIVPTRIGMRQMHRAWASRAGVDQGD